MDDPSTFTNDSTHTGCWNGIIFDNTLATNDSSKFIYSIFEYSKATLVDDSEQNKRDYRDNTGAVFHLNRFSKLYIANSIFRSNLAEMGGVISCFIDSSPIVINNLFYNNFSLVNASVLYSIYSYPEFTNNTIVENSVLNENSYYDTYTAYNLHSKSKFTNNIIRSNFVNTAQISSNKLFYTFNNNIEEYEFSSENANIDLEPFFDSENLEHPHSLLSNSPCINTGTDGSNISDNYFIHLTETDIAGRDRIVNEIIDIGAYEYTGVNSNYELVITNYELKQNYPNPFNPMTKIRYQLAVNSEQLGEIVVHNSAGQEIWSKNLSTDHSSPITNYCTFDGSKFNSGIYYYSLIVGGKKIDTKAMLLLK